MPGPAARERIEKNPDHHSWISWRIYIAREYAKARTSSGVPSPHSRVRYRQLEIHAEAGSCPSGEKATNDPAASEQGTVTRNGTGAHAAVQRVDHSLLVQSHEDNDLDAPGGGLRAGALIPSGCNSLSDGKRRPRRLAHVLPAADRVHHNCKSSEPTRSHEVAGTDQGSHGPWQAEEFGATPEAGAEHGRKRSLEVLGKRRV